MITILFSYCPKIHNTIGYCECSLLETREYFAVRLWPRPSGYHKARFTLTRKYLTLYHTQTYKFSLKLYKSSELLFFYQHEITERICKGKYGSLEISYIIFLGELLRLIMLFIFVLHEVCILLRFTIIKIISLQKSNTG